MRGREDSSGRPDRCDKCGQLLESGSARKESLERSQKPAFRFGWRLRRRSQRVWAKPFVKTIGRGIRDVSIR